MLDSSQVADELRMLRLPAVITRTGISRATIYRLIAEGKFPKQAKIGGSAVWAETEIQRYLQKAMPVRDE